MPLRGVQASSLANELRAGRKVVRDHLRVEGPLDLSGLESVPRLFKCRLCTFEGAVSAPDVTFERTVDLSGSTFEGAVDFRGATFRAPALFRATLEEATGEERPLVFRKPADFSLALFGEFASFGRSTFEDTAAFRDTRFADVAFGSTAFGTAAFDRASFRGATLFNSAKFAGPASFDEADFRARTDFSLAPFQRGASFTGAQFAQGASFLGAQFYTLVEEGAADVEEGAGAWFQNVASAGNLDFTFAKFLVVQAPPDSRIAVFEDVVCGGAVVFREATFAEGRGIGMTRLQVRDLVLDVDVVGQIDDEADRRLALQTIEESAKARGDLEVANHARYELQARRSEDYSPVGRLLDAVFYRGLAGYLVRPTHPIVALFGLVAAVSLARTLRNARAAGSASGGAGTARRRAWRRLWRRGGLFLTCFFDTAARAAPRLGGREAAASLGDRVERLAYRVLAVCALIALANSNPTLRDMVDTLF